MDSLLLLLTLLLYPLRKRWRVFARLGRMAGWFRFHMVAGVGGPDIGVPTRAPHTLQNAPSSTI